MNAPASAPDRSFSRPLAAAGLVLFPLLVFVLPPLLSPLADAHTAEEQFQRLAAAPADYRGLLLQAMGAMCLVPASVGVAVIVSRRRRGRLAGYVGALLGVVGACALLLALGVELAQARLLFEGEDADAMVDLALDLNSFPVFSAGLAAGLGCSFVVLPAVAVALRRGGVVPTVVPVLFLVPLAIGLLPVPEPVRNVGASVGLLLPCLWMAVALLRRSRSAAADRPSADTSAAQVVA